MTRSKPPHVRVSWDCMVADRNGAPVLDVNRGQASSLTEVAVRRSPSKMLDVAAAFAFSRGTQSGIATRRRLICVWFGISKQVSYIEEPSDEAQCRARSYWSMAHPDVIICRNFREVRRPTLYDTVRRNSSRPTQLLGTRRARSHTTVRANKR